MAVAVAALSVRISLLPSLLRVIFPGLILSDYRVMRVDANGREEWTAAAAVAESDPRS